ncbi:MAG: virulence-associated E family protein [Chloroflexia bacterium]
MGLEPVIDKPGFAEEFAILQQTLGTPPLPWLSQCQRSNGKLQNNLANVLVGLRNDSLLSTAIAFNEMLGTTFLVKPLTIEFNQLNFTPRPTMDHDVTRIQEYLQLAGLKGIGKDVTWQAIDARAMECKFHPLREHLAALSWDGVVRIDKWLSKYLGAESGPYASRIGEMFLISMVARVFEPGCKVDYMLVLEGPQGAGKSTACSILGREWFSDCMPEVTGGKDVSQHLAGKWLIEIAEMSAMNRAETSHLKAFVTRSSEQYRPPYARKEILQPRQCVFIGTTNKSVYLRDETGGRRFWPLKVGTIDSVGLKADRDQLLAEAVKQYQCGKQWYPDAEFERLYIKPEQQARFETDPWEHHIRSRLELFKSEKVYIRDLLIDELHIEPGRQSRSDSLRVAHILEHLGWIRLKKDSKGNVPWGLPS